MMISRYPFSVVVFVLLVVGSVAAYGLTPEQHVVLQERFGSSWPIFAEGRVWQLLTGMWVQYRPGVRYEAVVFVLSAVVALEHVAGTKWTAIISVSSDWCATLVAAVLMKLLAMAGLPAAVSTLGVPDSGASVMAHGAWAALAMFWFRRHWRRVMIVISVLAFGEFFFQHLSPAIAHGVGLFIGAAWGYFVVPAAAQRVSARWPKRSAPTN